MIQPFVYTAQPARVIFGDGTLARVPEEIARLGLRRVLTVSTPPQAGKAAALAARFPDRSAGVLAEAVMHTPVAVTEAAMRVVAERGADGLLALGGGSAIGLSKAIALRTGLPQIAVPTTYAGSEMTPVVGETRDGAKTTRSDPRILPTVVIYDVDLTMSLPPALSGTSGINAIAHAVEALYARDGNPVIALLALEAIGALHRALPRIVADPADRAARTEALYGAWLCGLCLGSVGMALHHKLCHTLGGRFGLPHAETHTAVLPHALAYNAPAIPDVMARLNAALGTGDAPLALYELAGRVGAERSLRALGMPGEEGEEEAGEATGDVIGGTVAAVLANPYWNPRPLEAPALRDLLSRAYRGLPPASS
ncbi:maleylacetate reductase [Roseomonas sp. NAR14]|uniref:Maleylacetate reductase n=1 Tax=Roseomonas acroporae TaxID=2937791 RepID=A0A9X1YC33_9PROT|nr:maleylacetate reductase [Roseomonas acroporae]MCK8787012.1 maleylacetate reductase [Roseomonas acroporae]